MEKLKIHKPVTPGLRGYISLINTSLYRGKIYYKRLFEKKRKSTGRNNSGRITVWHRGGGCKKKYRIIDWKRNKIDIKGHVERIEYDPNRNTYIALILYDDGERRYIISPDGLKVGDVIQTGFNVPIIIGNCTFLSNMSIGLFIHNIELYPGCGAVLSRSAGCAAQILDIGDIYTIIRLRSGEIRKVLSKCKATIGQLSNRKYMLTTVGKAGRSRWKNKRPVVRGVAMNPIDHPHGGGEGKTSSGHPPKSPWGKLDGKVTRKKKKFNSSLIIVSRRKKKK